MRHRLRPSHASRRCWSARPAAPAARRARSRCRTWTHAGVRMRSSCCARSVPGSRRHGRAAGTHLSRTVCRTAAPEGPARSNASCPFASALATLPCRGRRAFQIASRATLSTFAQSSLTFFFQEKENKFCAHLKLRRAARANSWQPRPARGARQREGGWRVPYAHCAAVCVRACVCVVRARVPAYSATVCVALGSRPWAFPWSHGRRGGGSPACRTREWMGQICGG